MREKEQREYNAQRTTWRDAKDDMRLYYEGRLDAAENEMKNEKERERCEMKAGMERERQWWEREREGWMRERALLYDKLRKGGIKGNEN